MNSVPAPIVVFAYNRPTHVLQCLQSIQENELAAESTLYIFCDGPKQNAGAADLEKISETRKNVKGERWCKEVHIIEHPDNRGLAASVMEGVTDIVNRHGKIIVLEDDLVVSKHFLKYMNEGLETYAHEENIYSINGYMFPLNLKQRSTFLLPYTSTWGWATWKTRWGAYSPKISEEEKKCLKNNRFLRQRFDLADYDYVSMLDFEDNSWGIKWYYSVFSRNGLNVFPTVSLVHNAGNDGSGTNAVHTGLSSEFDKNNAVTVTLENKLDMKLFQIYLDYFTAENNKFKNLIKKVIGSS